MKVKVQVNAVLTDDSKSYKLSSWVNFYCKNCETIKILPNMSASRSFSYPK